jgi:hypothetical protein
VLDGTKKEFNVGALSRNKQEKREEAKPGQHKE